MSNHIFMLVWFDLYLTSQSTVKVIWRLLSFYVGRRPQVALRALFQWGLSTLVEPPIFSKLAGTVYASKYKDVHLSNKTFKHKNLKMQEPLKNNLCVSNLYSR